MPGRLTGRNSRYVLATLNSAVRGALNGDFDAIVTAPVHKGIINDAGVPFIGHTEFFAEKTNTDHVVMMLVGAAIGPHALDHYTESKTLFLSAD